MPRLEHTVLNIRIITTLVVDKCTSELKQKREHAEPLIELLDTPLLYGASLRSWNLCFCRSFEVVTSLASWVLRCKININDSRLVLLAWKQ